MNTKTFNLYIKNSFSAIIKLTRFKESTSKIAKFKTKISSFSITKSYGEMWKEIGFSTNCTISAEEQVTRILYNYSVTSGSEDTWEKSYLQSDTGGSGAFLVFGFDTTTNNPYKTWMPFVFDFSGSCASAIRITSACLLLQAFDDRKEDSFKKLTMQIAPEIGANGLPPAGNSGINTKQINPYVTPYKKVMPDWTKYTLYNFDITSMLRQSLGAKSGSNPSNTKSAITWTNGSRLNLIVIPINSAYVKDKSVRYFYSANGALSEAGVSAPTINFDFEYIYYPLRGYDTHIQSVTSPCSVFYEALTFDVGVQRASSASGSPTTRGLIKVSLKDIPNSATVTSFTLRLYVRELYPATPASSKINLYKIIKNWDLYSVSWNRSFGSGYWDTPGLSGTTEYDSSGSVGYFTLPSSASFVTVTLPVALGQSWVTDGQSNYGLLLKLANEAIPGGGKVYSSKAYSALNDLAIRSPLFTIGYSIGATPYTKSIFIQNRVISTGLATSGSAY